MKWGTGGARGTGADDAAFRGGADTRRGMGTAPGLRNGDSMSR